ncbi:ATP-binding protein [Lutimaribacter marinistellae]|uniref:histidine kinase n=1 Tax=Lutimaribacter marinistellae TaxID=1820329 RepID=A0ABV7TLR9_9RHOB
MTDHTASSLPRFAARPPFGARIVAALLAGGALAALGSMGGFAPLVGQALIAAGASMMVVAVGLVLHEWQAKRVAKRARGFLSGFIENDATPSFITDDAGGICARNSAANKRFASEPEETLASTLRSLFANPTAVLYRLQARARREGNAREDVVARRGHVRMTVLLLDDGALLWRIEDIQEKPVSSRAESLPLPLLTVGRSGAVLYMNEAAREFVGSRVKSLDRLFTKLPIKESGVNQVSTASGVRHTIVIEMAGNPARREILLVPFGGDDAPREELDLSALPVPMMCLAPDGTVRDINPQAAEMLGDAAGGKNLNAMMEGLGRPVPDWLRETMSGTSGPRSEFLRLVRKDREVFVQVTLNRITHDGETGLLAVLADATELKSLEAQFVQSQKMQAVGQLAGGVAHDFNNLLTAISGHCDLLLLRHDQGDPDYGDLVQINQNANRAAALVGQLLAFSRKQTLRPEALDLRDTLADLTHLLNRLVGEKITLTLSHDPVLKQVRADKRQLEQVLMNLVVNARDAMPYGGEIRIETEVVSLTEPMMRDRATLSPGDWVTVKVIDEGTGIPADMLRKIFEPFYTTKRTGEGTGLGLSTAYGIVKQTGGFIFVDSVEGVGSEFTLYFPAASPTVGKSAPEQALPPRSVATSGEGVILLVEDEAPVRAFASRALRLRGYTVLEAESAEQALDLLEDKELEVDVFVTDVVMPGLDGPSWVRRALERRPETRVVFVSGYAEGAFREAEPEIPNSVFLPKPFSLSQLTETVQQQLH